MSEDWIAVGNVQILPLSDAIVDYPWPLAELFPGVPDEAWEPFRELYPTAFGAPDVWRSHYRCYLLRSQGRTVLMDTGMGPGGSPLAGVFRTSGHLLERLEAAAVAREDIEVVALSHLHPDHVGGNVQRDGDEQRLTFPLARYLVPEADWIAFHLREVQQHFPFSFVEETITPLQTLGALELIAGDHALTEELTLRPAPGHTPGHMTLHVKSQGQRALLVADALLHPAQVTEPDWSSMFDMEPDQDRLTRHRLLEQLETEGTLFAASHFPDPGFGRVERSKGRRYWDPLST